MSFFDWLPVYLTSVLLCVLAVVLYRVVTGSEYKLVIQLVIQLMISNIALIAGYASETILTNNPDDSSAWLLWMYGLAWAIADGFFNYSHFVLAW
jgi:hypothetical protein